MTHQQRIKAIRAQMTEALRAGKMGEYLERLESLGTVLLTEAQRVNVRIEHDMVRGGL